MSKLYSDFGIKYDCDGAFELHQLGISKVLTDLENYGVILFKNCIGNLEEFESFTRRFPYSSLTHASSMRVPLTDSGETKTVTEGNGEVLPHCELHHSIVSPKVIWFYCVTPPKSGGETTVFDGRAVYANLSEKSQGYIRDKKVFYHVVWSDYHWENYLPGVPRDQLAEKIRGLGGTNINFTADGNLQFSHQKSAVQAKSGVLAFANSILVADQYAKNPHVFYPKNDEVPRCRITFDHMEPISQELINEFLEATNKVKRNLAWEAGDCVMIDNFRVLHGRNSFGESDARKIAIRMGI